MMKFSLDKAWTSICWTFTVFIVLSATYAHATRPREGHGFKQPASPMRQLAIAIAVYASDNDHLTPLDLKALAPYRPVQVDMAITYNPAMKSVNLETVALPDKTVMFYMGANERIRLGHPGGHFFVATTGVGREPRNGMPVQLCWNSDGTRLEQAQFVGN